MKNMDWVIEIREWVNFLANICILLITIYTFYITFVAQKVRFLGMRHYFSNSDGNGFSIVVENKSFSPIIITDMSLIVEAKYRIEVKKIESPLILSPFSACKIDSDRYSYLDPKIDFDFRNTVLELTTSKRKLYIGRKGLLHKKAIKNDCYIVAKITNIYNGKIVPKGAKYALTLIKNGQQITCFIFETGLLTESILGCNGLPREVVKTQPLLCCYLDDWFKPKKIDYFLDTVNKYNESYL